MTVTEGVDVTSEVFAGKVQLKRYGQFMQTFYDRLRRAEENFDSTTTSVENYPVFLDFRPYEAASLVDIVDSGNIALDKILTALSAVCVEADYMTNLAKTKYYPFLLIYGEIGQEQCVGEAAALKSVAETLPFLQDLSVFVERCYELSRNFIHQMAGLYQNKSKVLDVKEIHFTTVFEMLGEILSVLMTLDEIIAHNIILKEHWNLYTKTLRLVRHNPEKFDTDQARLKPLESVCQKLDSQLMTGYIFQNCVEQPFDTDEIRVTQKGVLMDEFLYELKQIYQKLEVRFDNRFRGIVALSGLYVLYFSIYRTSDSKLLKTICECSKKIPCFTLIGDIVWNPVEFLGQKLSEIVDKKLTVNVTNDRNACLQNILTSLPRDVQNLTLRVTEWSSAMVSMKSLPSNVISELDRRYSLFFRGLRLAWSMSDLVKSICNGRLKQNEIASSTVLECLFRLIELLKIVENCFFSRWLIVSESAVHICQRSVVNLLKFFDDTKNAIRSDKKYSGRKLDTICGLVLIESALTSGETIERSFLYKLATHIVSAGKIIKTEDLSRLSEHFERIQTMVNLDKHVREACDCSLLMFHRSIIPIYFEKIFVHSTEINRLRHFFCALNDVASLVENGNNEKSLKDFENEILDVFRQNFIAKLNELIENDLRLMIHTHLKLDDRNPFNVDTTQNYASVFNLPPLRVGRRYIDVKRNVEQYLEKTFYNLTTVALHDWKTYGEMRQLAERKYNLILVEPHLPSQTLEQGLDALEIMRNIHIFVAKYQYNLNDQIFVEIASNNKHLNTLNIKHVANSIRTHGIGIMNTTVNFTYQFLRKKFYIFSQFLFDDHVKSRLTKDARYFRDHKEQLNGMYPFEKADKFNRGIRKLGFTPDGLSYFDQFRQLVTQIGNALGYVRLVRAGGLQSCSRSIQFIPDLEDVVNFEHLARDANLSDETLGSATFFDSLLDGLIKNFEEGTEYFKLLVDVFSTEFRNPKNVHLRNFYVIIPALIVNFVEHLMTSKERLSKKSREGGASFTDDGFAMGVAYILKLLDQYNEFDSLHWFSSVSSKYIRDKADILKQQTGNNQPETDEKLQHTLTLTKKRIEQYSKEFELVHFALRSARIFFRTDILGELIPKDKDPSDNGDAASVKSGS